MQRQQITVFYGDTHEYKKSQPTREEVMAIVDRHSPTSPFNKFIGNDNAVMKLSRAAFIAHQNPYHMMNEMAFALYGPSSAGKTTLASLYAQAVDLPFIDVSPQSFNRLDDLFDRIDDTLLNYNGTVLVDESGKDMREYRCPPCVILLDEVHAVSRKMIQGLLKATEPNDGMMLTERGRRVNMQYVTWMIATTDEGRLFDAFRTRFSPVYLKYLTIQEISNVIQLNYPDIPSDTCDIIAKYNKRVPRQALMFARDVRNQRQYDNTSWNDAAHKVARQENIDEFGMHEIHLNVLKSLIDGPISSARISTITGRKEEENERYIMPYLMTETEDQPAMVTKSPRGYVLTTGGMDELMKRGLVK